MNVVGHLDVGMHPATGLAREFSQPIEIDAVVLIGEETGLAVVAALDQVKRDVGQRQAGAAGHEVLVWKGLARRVTENVVCPLLSIILIPWI